ncbi:methylmalonyl-CoA mutase [candidate division TA06 bacterium]|uniref:Methylmalonyl-CoA mutase n=1 Tax=candidate division TA06 bacterium TaxID=2250710 RepID=A0A660SGX4_UNCT6|nr:MAG: methylmalonyl-CoA mutase [candidate division TA06 bacterium]
MDKRIIKSEKEKWDKNTVDPFMQKTPERKNLKDSSGEAIERLYTPLNQDDDYITKLNFPGQYPYTRGVYPTMYRGRYWTMRQYAGFGTAEESNERYRYLLTQGQTGLSVAFDLPTQIGYDSDDPISEGEVGKVGVAIDSLDDMEILFKNIPLDKVSTSMTINSTAAILLAMYIAVAEKQGVSHNEITGTIQNDILKEYIARGTYIFPPKPSMRLITNIFEFCSINIPKWNTISISGYHIREAGSSATQEVAFTIADGIAYCKAAINAGLDIDDFAGRLSFFFNSHNDLLEEVAKFRAARRMWAKIMKEEFKAKKPKSMKLRFHTQTAGSTLTAQQSDNNIIRVAIQTLAAILGGTQSLHTNSRDEALALPSEDSVRIALRTQQIVAFESGVSNTIDPLAGSYYIESLTDKIEKGAFEYLEKIEKMGGVVSAIEAGFIQKEIQNSAYKYQMEIESNDKIIVGVNKFEMEEPPVKGLLKVDMSIQKKQCERLRKVKERRDNIKVDKILKKLEQEANGDINLMPTIIDAVKSYTTIGEISNTLRKVFGEYKENIVL